MLENLNKVGEDQPKKIIGIIPRLFQCQINALNGEIETFTCGNLVMTAVKSEDIEVLIEITGVTENGRTSAL